MRKLRARLTLVGLPAVDLKIKASATVVGNASQSHILRVLNGSDMIDVAG